MRVLLVEDNADSCKAITHVLSRERLKVDCVSSDEEASEYFRKGGLANLVLSDHHPPVVDGFKLLKAMRQNQRLKSIPFILCLNATEKKAVLEAMKLGVSDFLAKPLSVESLICKVRKAFDSSKQTVLIVEDEKLLREICARIIERKGYQTIKAESAQEAIQLLEVNTISAVISDVNMPGMNGLQLMKMIKCKWAQMPVVLMTGHTDKYSKEDLLADGADGFILKPFNNIEMLNTITAIIG